jgi:hypothetical protein
MGWEEAIRSERQHGEIIHLRRELELARQQIARLEQKSNEADPQFYERESMDSTSPHWLSMNFISN